MFEMLTERLDGVFKTLRGHGRLSESNIDEAMREVRRALLEADVNYKVARSFIGRVKERAVGQEVLKSITPGQQVVKVVKVHICRNMQLNLMKELTMVKVMWKFLLEHKNHMINLHLL